MTNVQDDQEELVQNPEMPYENLPDKFYDFSMFSLHLFSNKIPSQFTANIFVYN